MTKTLYVNGDSHTAGTTLQFPHHNYEKCFGGLLAAKYNLEYKNDAIPGGSNNRIIRTSKEYLKYADAQNTVVLIGWSTFERTEWLVNGQWHQICGQPQYEIKEKHLGMLWKNYTASFLKSWEKDNKEEGMFYLSKTIEAQYQIKEFSQWLLERDFKHLFFHAHKSFFYKKSIFQIDWSNDIWFQDKPYDPTISFCNYSLSKGHQPDHWYHFDYNAHRDYAEFVEPEFAKLLG
jgi:hypothetical protein